MAFAGALGLGMPVTLVAGVRGADLAPDDPLRGEWDLVVIGPHFAAALAAKDCGDTGPDRQRRFDFVVTHDRELVIRAAEPLLRRLLRKPDRHLRPAVGLDRHRHHCPTANVSVTAKNARRGRRMPPPPLLRCAACGRQRRANIASDA